MRKKPRYTEKVHARRLIQMLERKHKDGILGCPAARDFGVDTSCYELWEDDCSGNVHKVCTTFADSIENTNSYYIYCCPCSYFKSCEEAAKQAWLTLEEKGYI